MANLSFGLPTLMSGTGGSKLSYGDSVGKTSLFGWMSNPKSSDYSMGTSVGWSQNDARREYVDTRNAAPKAPVNTAQIDGGSSFLNALSGFAMANLSSIGGQPEQAPQVQHVAYGPEPTNGAFDLKTLAIIAAAGFGIYYVAKS